LPIGAVEAEASEKSHNGSGYLLPVIGGGFVNVNGIGGGFVNPKAK
jgi:hypothetical protein